MCCQEIGSLHPVMHSSRGSRYRRKKHHLYQPRAIPSLPWPISKPLPVPSFFIDCQWAQRVWSDIWTAETMSLGATQRTWVGGPELPASNVFRLG